jgi:hypothetical protein
VRPSRPPLDVARTRDRAARADGVSFSLETPAGAARVRLALPGPLQRLQRARRRVPRAWRSGVLDVVVGGLERFAAAFGRFERFAAATARAPAARQEPRGRERGDPDARGRVCAGDARRRPERRIADGRDVSWIWDVDFEPLLERA